VLVASIALFAISGHHWNADKVVPKMLYTFDFIIALLIILVIAIMMQDATENQKNMKAALLLLASGLSIAPVFL